MGSFCRRLLKIFGEPLENKRIGVVVLLDYLDGSLWTLGFACSAN